MQFQIQPSPNTGTLGVMNTVMNCRRLLMKDIHFYLVCMCMYVCVYVCIYVCICVYVYVHVWVCVCVCVCVYVCMLYVCMYVCGMCTRNSVVCACDIILFKGHLHSLQTCPLLWELSSLGKGTGQFPSSWQPA